MFIREDWKTNSHFHPYTDSEILELVHKNLKSTPNPVLLLDLDSTLYEVAPRTHAIISDWYKSTKGKFTPLISKLENLKTEQIGYSLGDTFKTLGIDINVEQVKSAFSDLKDFWWSKFFTNEYLPHDRHYSGANTFAQKAHELGAFLVYLTGREEKPMIEGTVKNLIRDKFPWDTGRTTLLMRQSATQSDLEHKALAADKIRNIGTLIASFENEPQNVVTLYKAFPESMHVFMDTVCSDHPAEALKGIYKLKDFSSYSAIS